MPTFLSVSPGFATPYSQWGSDIAEFSSSGPPSAAANAKGTAEPHGSVSEGKAEGRPGLVRRDYPSACLKRAVVCNRDSARSNIYPTFTPTATVLQTCLSSPSSSLPSSAYIAAYLFASPRVVNHSILPIGMKPAITPKPLPPSTTSSTSPVRDALRLSPDTLRGTPSLQPGTAKEERERRLQAVSHHRKAELPEVLRRVDASKDSQSTERPRNGASRSAKEQSKPKDAGRNRDRSSTTSSQTTVRKIEPETVRCTTTPLDWPHPNSVASPQFPPLIPSTRALNVQSSTTRLSSEHSTPYSSSQPSSLALSSSTRGKETQIQRADKLASDSRPSTSMSTPNVRESAVTPERIRATFEPCHRALHQFSQTMRSREPYTRQRIHANLLAAGKVQVSVQVFDSLYVP